MALLPPFARRTLALLRRPLLGSDLESAREACEAIAARIATRLEAHAPRIDGAALLEARLAASTSGRTPPVRAAFGRANQALAEAVTSGRALDVALLAELNGALRGHDGPAPLRRSPVSLDGHECPSAEAMAAMLAPLPRDAEARAREVHPIAGAALVYAWIATVHPFDDGNGRTARLATDLVLARAGLPPACISDDPYDHVVVRASNADYVTPRFVIDVVVRGLERTESLLWP